MHDGRWTLMIEVMSLLQMLVLHLRLVGQVDVKLGVGNESPELEVWFISLEPEVPDEVLI